MNPIYLNEIQDRVFASVTDLNSLCKDIPLNIFSPFEYVSNNAYYGMDVALKSYAGLPQSYYLKAHYSHISIAAVGDIWIEDYNTLPMLFTWAPSHEKAYKKVCRKPMYSIGPIIHYAQNAYTEEKIDAEKKRLGRNALFFPTHSSHESETVFSVEESLAALKSYEKEFDNIRVSIYWSDFLNNRHKPFLSSGYECVTAGHMFDPYFLPRLKALLSVTDYTFGNTFGTNIAYSIYMKKPFTLLSQEIIYDFGKDPALIDNSEHRKACKSAVDKFLENFTHYSPEVSALQYNLCNYYFGYDQVRTRDGLLTLLEASEDFFNAIMKKNL